MKHYTPFKDVAEFNALCDINQVDKDEIKLILEQINDNFYPANADEEGVARWEKITGVKAEGTLNERKFKLKSVVNNHAPYTERRIKGMINNLVGEGNYTFNLTGLSLEVRLQLGTKSNLKTVEELLNNTLPAHLSYLASLQYNSNSMLMGMTHAQLSTMTHTHLKEGIL